VRTGNLWNAIALVAFAGIYCGACSAAGGAIACTDKRTCSGPMSAPPAVPASGAAMGPCDIYAADGGPCVAAHSTVRALFATYSGPLYQVKKPDSTTADVHPLAPGGLANSAEQDTFCGTASCTISIIYDQSGWGNHLTSAPAGMAKTTPDNEANAKSVPIMLGTQRVYGVHVVPGIGYRNNAACGTAACDDAETEYMVVGGGNFNGSCCFDYGNMETNSRDNGEGTMEAVYFGTCTIWNKGAGDGPWVMGDLENGLWAGDSSPYAGNMPITGWPYVTGLVKGESTSMTHPNGHWTIKEGNATSGALMMPFDGQRPSARYHPMRKEGGIGLGTGGDNTSGAKGDWFEGVMTSAYSSNAADDAVQANVVSIYGQ
jgi:non-reducing end alpha-L-arabinofuranosidase